MNFKTYIISSTVNNKLYVGINGDSLSSRFNQHINKSNNSSQVYLHRAIRKYGADKFSIRLEKGGMTSFEAAEREKSLIADMGTMAPSGYNMTGGGEGCFEPCEQVRMVKSKKAKALHQDPDFKKRHRDGIMSCFTPERRLAISKKHKGKKMHPNAARAILEAKKTDEYKEIASAAARKTWEQDGYKEKWAQGKLEKHIQKAKKFPMREDGLIFSSTRSAAKYMQENHGANAACNNICMACNGKYKTSCGYKWSWIDGDKAREIGGII